jgi:hypothetical protein
MFQKEYEIEQPYISELKKYLVFIFRLMPMSTNDQAKEGSFLSRIYAATKAHFGKSQCWCHKTVHFGFKFCAHHSKIPIEQTLYEALESFNDPQKRLRFPTYVDIHLDIMAFFFQLAEIAETKGEIELLLRLLSRQTNENIYVLLDIMKNQEIKRIILNLLPKYYKHQYLCTDYQIMWDYRRLSYNCTRFTKLFKAPHYDTAIMMWRLFGSSVLENDRETKHLPILHQILMNRDLVPRLDTMSEFVEIVTVHGDIDCIERETFYSDILIKSLDSYLIPDLVKIINEYYS